MRTIKEFSKIYARVNGEDFDKVLAKVRMWVKTGKLPTERDPVCGWHLIKEDPHTYKPAHVRRIDSVTDIATKHGVSRQTVYNWKKKGKIK